MTRLLYLVLLAALLVGIVVSAWAGPLDRQEEPGLIGRSSGVLRGRQSIRRKGPSRHCARHVSHVFIQSSEVESDLTSSTLHEPSLGVDWETDDELGSRWAFLHQGVSKGGTDGFYSETLSQL